MSEAPLSASTREALDAFAARTDEPFPRARSAAVLQSALSAAQGQPPRTLLNAAAFALACAVGFAGVSSLVGGAKPPSRADEVQASSLARWHWEGSALKVEAGHVRLAPIPGRQFAFVTPVVEAMVSDAAAMVDVSETATTLAVERGEVTWRAASRTGTLRAGEKLIFKSAVPPLSAAPRGPPLASCLGGTGGGGYEACVAVAAEGAGLAAETALFELGMAARDRGDVDKAVRQFRLYSERFPGGMFAPEASIVLMLTLRDANQLPEAVSEARRFLLRFPDEPRTLQVRRWAAQLP